MTFWTEYSISPSSEEGWLLLLVEMNSSVIIAGMAKYELESSGSYSSTIEPILDNDDDPRSEEILLLLRRLPRCRRMRWCSPPWYDANDIAMTPNRINMASSVRRIIFICASLYADDDDDDDFLQSLVVSW